MKFFKNKKGFTLVELVVVIAILGILAGIAIPRFMDATASARGSKIVADLRTIDSAVTMYYAQNGGSYPSANGAELTPNYIASWPKPPEGKAIFPRSANQVDIGNETYTLNASHVAVLSGHDTFTAAYLTTKS